MRSVKRIRLYLWRFLINELIGSCLIGNKLRPKIYNLLGVRVLNPKTVCIESGVKFRTNNVIIASGVFINQNVFFDNNSLIQIDENVAIGGRVRLITSGHMIGNKNQRAGQSQSSPILVEKGVWIGDSVVILGGVTIGAGSILGACTLVNGNVESDSLYVGVPARFKRRLDA